MKIEADIHWSMELCSSQNSFGYILTPLHNIVRNTNVKMQINPHFL